VKYSPAHTRYMRRVLAEPAATIKRAATVAEAARRAADTLSMPVLVNGKPEFRAVAGFDHSAGRRVPVLAEGEQVRYGLDGTTHVVTGAP